MLELVPDWDASKIRPSEPQLQKLPYPPGMTTRWAMDLIREATEPFSSRQLAEKIVETQGGDLDDSDLVNRVREAIDVSLRSKLGTFVKYVQQRPTLWKRIDDDEPG